MTKEEALKIMCMRCALHHICKGTGCTPKKVLEEEVNNE